MAGKYLSGSGLGYLWTKIKDTFLYLPEEITNPSTINRKFATFSEASPHDCGNSVDGMNSGSRILIPLQVSPDFDGSNGCYVYKSYANSSTFSHRTVYQIGNGRLYTVPTSGNPALVTMIPNVDGGIASTSVGFYIKQDSVHGNWWLTNSNDTINNESFGIVNTGGGTIIDPELPDPPVIVESSTIYITGTTLDSSELSDTPQDFWASDNAYVYVRYKSVYDFSQYHFTAPVTTNGGIRLCRHVPDGGRTWTYTLTRNSTGSSISINREIDSYDPGNPE